MENMRRWGTEQEMYTALKATDSWRPDPMPRRELHSLITDGAGPLNVMIIEIFGT